LGLSNHETGASPASLAACFVCGAPVPDINGPVHKYVPSSPGCWRTFGEVQADEMTRFGYPPAHRLVVDAYMAQHPGDGSDRRDRQSVFVHLAGLCAVIDMEMPAPVVTNAFRRLLARHEGFPRLQRGPDPGALTVLHMVGAADLDDYERRAREWGQAVWASWDAHQAAVRNALEAVL
jgi:hypothetical protein